MKLCDYCETALPDDASACAQCGMVLPEAEDVTIKSWSIATALEDAASKGRPVPNPETPVPEVTILDTLLTLDDDDITRRDSAPTMPDDAIISGDSAPTLEVELSDAAIVFAYAPWPIIATDPNLSVATIDTLVTDIDRQDDPTPVNGHYAEPLEESETLPVMSFAEADEETAPQNGYDIPAPLYPDYGKANATVPTPLYANSTNETDYAAIALEDAHTVPTPLYENYKKTASQATAAAPLRLLPRKISIAYPLLWSRRSLIAIALCFLLILGSIGVFIFSRSQPGSGPRPVIHTIAAKLQALTPSLNSQSVQGHKVILAAEIANAGGQILHWTADTGHTPWLSIDKQSGIIPSGAPQQTIFTTADARQLTVGNYTGALQLHSNGGEANILVSLMVVPSTNQKQATMTVDPPSLTFGTLQQGQQATNIVTISNAGTGTLNWHASADSNSGITLTPPSGTILAGGYPQELAATINTATLTPGLTTAHINFTSNASNTPPSVGVSVNVTPANGNILTISASPGSFTNGCLICTVILTASQGGQGMQPSVQWSTSGVGLPGIAFSPASGTLLAGQSMPVQVTVPNTSCPTSANFTFAGAANTVPVLWSCTPPPTPTPILTASPTSLSNCYTCTVYISPAVGSLSNLVWTSSSIGINGITFTPSSGTVTPGNTQKVTVNVPQPQNCPTSANFTFSGQGAGNGVTVAWNCTAPAPQNPLLSVSPNTLNSSQCSGNNDGTYNCTVTLSESPAGNIGWSTYTNVGGTFSPASGQFSNGQTQVQVTINNMLCQPGSFGFQGSYNSASVQWNCMTQTSTLNVNPTSLNQSSSVCSSDGNGGYNCYVSLSETPQGTLNWTETDSLGVTVSQANGTLTPGNSSLTVYLYSIPCNMDTFTFSATNSNTINVNWTCLPPTQSPQPLTLSENISSFVADSNCTWNGNGWDCVQTITVSNGTGNLNWNASSDLPVTFNPASGTLNAGQSVNVTVSIPPNDCSSGHSFSYNWGTNQNVSASWSCTAPQISTSPTSLVADSNCPNNGNSWTCSETLYASSGSGMLPWSVSVTMGGVTGSAHSGTLTPGGNTTINIYIPSNDCQSATFYFTGPTNTAQVSWSCTPLSLPQLNVSPQSLSFNNLPTNTTQTQQLTISNGGGQPLTWSATSSANWLSLDTSSGTVNQGSPQTINVTVNTQGLSNGQSYSGTISFTSNGGSFNVMVSLTIAANPVPPTLTISPNNLKDTDCTYSSGNGWSCNLTFSVNANATSSLSWALNGGGSPNFNPSSGTIQPGQSEAVTMTVGGIPYDCPFGVTNYIVDQNGNNYPIIFNCQTPPFSASPGNIGPSTCTANPDGSYTCQVTLSLGQYPYGTVPWHTYTNVNGVVFSPPSGNIGSGQNIVVNITIPAGTQCLIVLYFDYNQIATATEWNCSG